MRNKIVVGKKEKGSIDLNGRTMLAALQRETATTAIEGIWKIRYLTEQLKCLQAS